MKSHSIVEHVNFTVSEPKVVAELLCKIFSWNIRWSGTALDEGLTIHVGGEESYLALYAHPEQTNTVARNYKSVGNLNHIGIIVSDLEQTEKNIKALGIDTFNHRNYHPGRRFYFLVDDIEFEVISY